MIDLSEHSTNDVCILSLTGKMTGAREAEALYAKFKKYRERELKKVVLNLKKLEWVGSIGIGAIFGCLTSIRNIGGDLRLAALNPKMQQLVAVTNLDTILRVYKSVDAAVNDSWV